MSINVRVEGRALRVWNDLGPNLPAATKRTRDDGLALTSGAGDLASANVLYACCERVRR